MFTAFIKLLLSQRLLVLMVTIVLGLGGILAWKHLPIDAFPDVTNVQVMILAKAPGLAAIEVEQKVSFPLEQAMSGLPRVTMVRSLS
nr:efflux RND transporter permease subunit [Deltaproteobacteria bacterium]